MAQKKISKTWQKYLRQAASILATKKPGQWFDILGDGKFQFYMPDVEVHHECGTAGCILGLVKVLSRVNGTPALDSLSAPKCLDPLFYPNRIDMEKVTPKGAAKTIRRFLRTGAAKWSMRDQV
jgi:hypothetical protein